MARQPPTIVTLAELHFYDSLLIRPSDFVNSAALLEIYRLWLGVWGGIRNWLLDGSVVADCCKPFAATHLPDQVTKAMSEICMTVFWSIASG